jgi:DNA helicase HerA-like ATPase
MTGANIKHVLINGASGTGKTEYFKRNILKPAMQKKIKVIIIDPEDEYEEIPKTSIKNILDDLKVKTAVRYVPNLRQNDYLEQLDKLYMKIFDNVRGCIIAIDEARFCGGEQHKLVNGLLELITRGRKRNLKLVVITQRIALLDKTITGNCQIKVLFKCAEDVDWDRYRKINKELAEKLKHSKNDHAYIYINGLNAKLVE